MRRSRGLLLLLGVLVATVPASAQEKSWRAAQGLETFTKQDEAHRDWSAAWVVKSTRFARATSACPSRIRCAS